MPLEDVVSKLRKLILNIRERGESIGEQNTKSAVIDPLLAALGWNTQDLTEVRHEYKPKSRDKPVDYALFLPPEPRPRLFIEAKALDTDLTNRQWWSQIVNYANNAGVKWCVLTDGDEYRLFNANAEVHIDEKLFRTIRISISSADEQASTVQTLALLSKDKMAQNLLASRWTAHFVDRKVKTAVQDLFKNEDPSPSLIRLLHKKTTGLKTAEIRASLKRAVPIRIDFPVVPAPIPADGEKLSAGKQAALTRKARRLAAGVDQADAKLSDLIEAGVIQTPLHLEKEYKGVHLKAVIQNNGTVTVNNEAYDSLSTAGGMARKSVIGAKWRPTFPGQTAPQTNGWTFWKFQDPETGKLLEVDVFRQKHLKRSQPDFAKA